MPQYINKSLFTVASVAVIAASLAGCSSFGSSKSSSLSVPARASAPAINQSVTNLPTLAAAKSTGAMHNASTAGLTPPNAKPGQCFTRVIIPPQYETISSRQMVEDAGEKIQVIPASYKTGSKRVLVSEASEKYEIVPATYRTVTERVMVKAASSKLHTQPAVYETVTSRVIEKPAHTAWKKGTGPIQKIDEKSGDIMCLVDVPATYKTIQKRVLKTPAKTTTVAIPAQYRTIEKRVVATPATTRKVIIPASYKNISVTEEATPARAQRTAIPARYKTVTSQKLVKPGSTEWREILCETNMTRSRIIKLQGALKAAGYNPGPLDGNIGSETMSAVNAYQRSKGLPVDRYLNMATVRSLGVAI